MGEVKEKEIERQLPAIWHPISEPQIHAEMLCFQSSSLPVHLREQAVLDDQNTRVPAAIWEAKMESQTLTITVM